MSSQRSVQDSLSRCHEDIYSSMYQVNNHKDLKKIDKTVPVQKDTIEVSKDQIKKEALERLHHTKKYLVIQNGFMRIGKYVFMGVVIPPYLIIYAIPKWVCLAALPSLFQVVYPVYYKASNRVKNTIEAVKKGFNGAVHAVRGYVDVFVQPIIRIGLDIKNAIKRFSNHVNTFLIQGAERLKVYLKRLYFKNNGNGENSRLTRFHRLAEMIESGLIRTVEKLIIQPFLGFLEVRDKGVEWLRVKPREISMNIFQRLSVGMLPFIEGCRLRFQTSRQWVDHAIKTLQPYIQPYFDDLKYAIYLISVFYSKYIFPILNGLKTSLINASAYFNMLLKKGAQKINNFLNVLKSKSQQDNFIFSFKWLPKRVRQPIIGLVSRKTIQTTIKLIYKSLYQILNRFWLMLQRVLLLLRRGMELAFNSIKKVINIGKNVLFKGCNYLHRIVLSSMWWLGRRLRHILVITLMLIYLTIWGFHIAAKIIHRFLPIPSKSS